MLCEKAWRPCVALHPYYFAFAAEATAAVALVIVADASPAITIARAVSDTFAGMIPLDVRGFIAAQIGLGYGRVARCVRASH